uniref:Ig-like domain-containing protein n=1 Tax=Periophthalmus magnuspinnatus TaxID=409849 RepID=A0A3B4ANL9_9GOBI
HNLNTKLGSSVLLPCNFTQAQNIVSWIQSPTVNVVTITPTGRVNFSDPRFGRIHTFPNEGSLGNYSISISNVNHTDLGCYRCLNQEKCVQVGLVLETGKHYLCPTSIINFCCSSFHCNKLLIIITFTIFAISLLIL